MFCLFHTVIPFFYQVCACSTIVQDMLLTIIYNNAPMTKKRAWEVENHISEPDPLKAIKKVISGSFIIFMERCNIIESAFSSP